MAARRIDRQRQTVGSKRPGVLQCAGEEKGNRERESERGSQRAADVRSAAASEGEQKPQSIRQPRAAGDGVGGGEGLERESGSDNETKRGRDDCGYTRGWGGGGSRRVTTQLVNPR